MNKVVALALEATKILRNLKKNVGFYFFNHSKFSSSFLKKKKKKKKKKKSLMKELDSLFHGLVVKV